MDDDSVVWGVGQSPPLLPHPETRLIGSVTPEKTPSPTSWGKRPREGRSATPEATEPAQPATTTASENEQGVGGSMATVRCNSPIHDWVRVNLSNKLSEDDLTNAMRIQSLIWRMVDDILWCFDGHGDTCFYRAGGTPITFDEAQDIAKASVHGPAKHVADCLGECLKGAEAGAQHCIDALKHSEPWVASFLARLPFQQNILRTILPDHKFLFYTRMAIEPEMNTYSYIVHGSLG